MRHPISTKWPLERRPARWLPVTPRDLCALSSPANLLMAGVLVLGWFALIGWTGAGPDGWQARICSGLDLRPTSCGGVATGDEAGHAARGPLVTGYAS